MKVYKCQHCKYNVVDNKLRKNNAKHQLGVHYETTHKQLLPDDMSGYQWAYYTITKRIAGNCVICKKETSFNETTMKYSRFCDNPLCKEKYREQFKNRMISKYGKVHLLNDPEMQIKMMSNRKIAGKYTWSDKSTTVSYVSSYELDFLKFLDITLKWKSSDIIAPSAHVYHYQYNDNIHFYIPDFFIPSMNLEVEIKDDGSARHISQVSREKDVIKEQVIKTNNHFNFIKIVNKNYNEFVNLIKEE